MRQALALTALILCMCAATTQARAQRHEPFWQAGADFLSGPNELVAGIGSGPGYRFHLTESWHLAAEIRFLMMAGNRVSVGLGGAYGFCSGLWRPTIGVFSHVYLGQEFVIVNSNEPEPPALPTISLALRLSPLHFDDGRYSATVLAVSPAVAVTSKPLPFGFSITLLAVGARF
jgi:hypothetical protein